jgi:hypothetical protein
MALDLAEPADLIMALASLAIQVADTGSSRYQGLKFAAPLRQAYRVPVHLVDPYTYKEDLE